MEDFLKLFFDEGEQFCVSPDQYAYHSVGVESFKENSVKLVSPNPDFSPKTVPFSSMALMAVNPINGFRNDNNCTSLRNFLIEMDDGTLEEQYNYIKSTGLPYSCCVYSGGKSLHFGVALTQDLKSIETYRDVAKWILSICSKADQQTGNPSRCIRVPDAKRGDKVQRLLENKGRISLDDLYSFLSKNKEHRPKKDKIREKNKEGVLSHWATNTMRDIAGAAAKSGEGRNQTWFKVFASFADSGYSFDDTVATAASFFEEEEDFREAEWLSAAESAYRRAGKR